MPKAVKSQKQPAEKKVRLTKDQKHTAESLETFKKDLAKKKAELAKLTKSFDSLAKRKQELENWVGNLEKIIQALESMLKALPLQQPIFIPTIFPVPATPTIPSIPNSAPYTPPFNPNPGWPGQTWITCENKPELNGGSITAKGILTTTAGLVQSGTAMLNCVNASAEPLKDAQVSFTVSEPKNVAIEVGGDLHLAVDGELNLNEENK